MTMCIEYSPCIRGSRLSSHEEPRCSHSGIPDAPDSQQPSRTPLDHRRSKIYWARQLHSVCMAAMDEIAETRSRRGSTNPCRRPHGRADLGPQQLAGRIGIDRATVGRSVARLERRGLVTCTTVAGQTRSRRLNLTPEGTEQRLRLRSAVILAQDRRWLPVRSRTRDAQRRLSGVWSDQFASGAGG